TSVAELAPLLPATSAQLAGFRLVAFCKRMPAPPVHEKLRLRDETVKLKRPGSPPGGGWPPTGVVGSSFGSGCVKMVKKLTSLGESTPAEGLFSRLISPLAAIMTCRVVIATVICSVWIPPVCAALTNGKKLLV